MNVLIGNHIEEKEIKFVKGYTAAVHSEKDRKREEYDGDRLAIFLFRTITSNTWEHLKLMMDVLEKSDNPREKIIDLEEKHKWMKNTFYFEED